MDVVHLNPKQLAASLRSVGIGPKFLSLGFYLDYAGSYKLAINTKSLFIRPSPILGGRQVAHVPHILTRDDQNCPKKLGQGRDDEGIHLRY
jgi:hypothetical protein